jgi:hypothetical protein
VLQGVNQTTASLTATIYATTSTISYLANANSNRSATIQGAYQIAGWAISIAIGIIAGIAIGFVYRILDDTKE